jgi:hypothetical protein
MTWRALQCSALFFGVVLLTGVGGDVARAAAARAVGLPNTLFTDVIAYEQVPTSATQAAVILIAPHVWELALAALGALVYARARGPALRLFALYLAATGAMDVLMSIACAPFSGDLSDLAAVLDLPAVLVISAAVTAALVMLVVWWAAGSHLQPPASTILVPWIVDLAMRPIVYAPIPVVGILMMWMGSAPWLAVIGVAFWRRRRSTAARTMPPAPMRLWFAAWMLPVLLATVVRAMTVGVHFG